MQAVLFVIMMFFTTLFYLVPLASEYSAFILISTVTISGTVVILLDNQINKFVFELYADQYVKFYGNYKYRDKLQRFSNTIDTNKEIYQIFANPANLKEFDSYEGVELYDDMFFVLCRVNNEINFINELNFDDFVSTNYIFSNNFFESKDIKLKRYKFYAKNIQSEYVIRELYKKMNLPRDDKNRYF